MSTISFDETLFDRIVATRRDLHRNPELSWKEHRTAAKVCEFLDRIGIRYASERASTGVIAEIPAAADAPYIALRADMDALPIHEETGLPFSSAREGVMHACGHDGHTSMLLGAASLLAAEPQLPAPVRLIFQPGEETGDGAREMIKARALDDVAMIFGGHVDRHYPVGSIVVSEGAVNASSDKFSIHVAGLGGHAARPHETVDAVVVGSLFVMALQTIVSREINPAHPSVVTVGRFDAGTAPNVIAGEARLQGTIRAQDQDVREHLQKSIERIARSLGQLHGAEIAVDISPGTPPVINRDETTKLARQAALVTVAPKNVLKLTTANMGAEDFAHYMEKVPGCYVRFGSTRPGQEAYPAHSSKFDFDEEALAIGASYYCAVAKIAGEAVAKGEFARNEVS